MQYKTFGPFKMPCTKNQHGTKIFDFEKVPLVSFWEEVDKEYPKLSQGRGCYIFAYRAGKGIRPWYVGQSKGPFINECFEYQKRDHYVKVQNSIKTGTPILAFVARLTDSGKLSRSIPPDEADFVEKLLIGLALSKNGDLRNTVATKYLRKLQIPGVLNSTPGKPSAGASLLRSILVANPTLLKKGRT